jgi:hypothetical protein
VHIVEGGRQYVRSRIAHGMVYPRASHLESANGLPPNSFEIGRRMRVIWMLGRCGARSNAHDRARADRILADGLCRQSGLSSRVTSSGVPFAA